MADDVKKGSIPIRLVNQAKTVEQEHIEKMKVLDVVGRKEASGSKVIRTKWVVTNKGTPEKPNVRAGWDAQEYKWMDGPDCEHYAPTPGLDLAAAAGKSNDHVVAVVDVRRAYFYAEPLPKTFVELPDYFDIDTRTRCCGRLRRCLYGTRQAARSWQREIEKSIKAAGILSKCSFKSPCGKLVGVVHGDDILLSDQDHLLMRCGMLYGNAMRYVNRCWERDQKMQAGIRISPDPRHVKDIIEELGLEGAKPADTPMIVSRSDSRALSMRDATLHKRTRGKVELLGNGSTRHSLRCIDHGKPSIKPERCEHGQTQKTGTISDWAGRCDQTESWLTRTVIGQQTAKTCVQ